MLKDTDVASSRVLPTTLSKIINCLV